MEDLAKTKISGARKKGEKVNIPKRRLLKNNNLQAPHYKINPRVLTESYMEYEIQFVGLVPDVTSSFDATNRTDVLKLIDKGRKDNQVVHIVTDEDKGIMVINTSIIKLLQRDTEELLLEAPIYMVAAVSYIKEDNCHILCLKIGDVRINTEVCDLVVLYCETKNIAEEICAVIEQYFQHIYTEATMKFFDFQLGKTGSSTGLTSSERSPFYSESLITSSGRETNLSQWSCQPSVTLSDRSSTAGDLIQSYMTELTNKLNGQELREFAILLQRWHSRIPFEEFCQKLFELYGPERKYLMAGIRSFVPEEYHDYFEQFLKQLCVSEPKGTMAAAHSEQEGACSSSACYIQRRSEYNFPYDEIINSKNELASSDFLTYL